MYVSKLYPLCACTVYIYRSKFLFNLNTCMHEAHRSKHVRIVNWHWIPMVIIAVIGLLSPICSRFKRPTDRRRVPWPREAHGPSAASNEPDRRVQTCSCDSDGKLANTPNRLERCEICRYSIRKTLNRLI